MKSINSIILLVLVGLGLGLSIWVGRGPELAQIEVTAEAIIQTNTSPVVMIGLNVLEKSHLEFVKKWIDHSSTLGKPIQSIIAQTAISVRLTDLGQMDPFEPDRDNHGVYAALKKVSFGSPGAVLVLTDQVQALSVAQSSLASLFKEGDSQLIKMILVTPEPIKDSALQRVTCPDERLTECMAKRSQLLALLRSKAQSDSSLWWQWSANEKVVVLGRF